MTPLDDCIERYRSFYENPSPALLVQVRCTYLEDPRRPAQSRFLKELGEYDFADPTHRRRWFEDVVGEVRRENRMHPVPDDYLPSAKILLGQLQSLILKDRSISHAGGSTWVEPCLDRLDDWKSLKAELDSRNPWWELYREARVHVCESIGTDGFVATMHGMGPLDLAYDLRGLRLYTDMMDDPRGVYELVGFCADAIRRMAEGQRAIDPVGDTRPPRTDGTFWVAGWGYDVLVPGNGGHLTVDTSCQISEAQFHEFEAPHLERLCGGSPGWLMHVHAAGRHLLRRYASIDGVRILQLVWDPNRPKPVEDFNTIGDLVGTTPVLLTATPQELYDNMDALRRGRVVVRTDAASESQAREIVAFVRSNSRIG